MKKSKATEIIERLKQQLIDYDTPINQDIDFKLSLLYDYIIEYEKCKNDVITNGIVITTNRGATKCLNPSYKAKIEITKLMLKILKEIGFNNQKTESETPEEAQDFINYLVS